MPTMLRSFVVLLVHTFVRSFVHSSKTHARQAQQPQLVMYRTIAYAELLAAVWTDVVAQPQYRL